MLGGWKTLSMVMRYVHTNADEHVNSIDALPGGGGQQGNSEIMEVEKA